MREKPALWPKGERIQWGCVLMRMLGEDSLENLHVVLAGLRSVERSRQAAPLERAIQTTRVILGDLLTKNAVQRAIFDFSTDAVHRSFNISPETLKFTPIYADGRDSNIQSAEHTLNKGLARKLYDLEVADPDKDLLVEYGDVRLPIRLHGLKFPPPRKHDLTRRPRQALKVSIIELQELAQQLDQEDRDAVPSRPSQGWADRAAFCLKSTNGSGLSENDVLDLSGLKHIIGLPGSGKTTLITLLCVLLKRRGQRVAVFFTSISVAREYLEMLRRYDVNTAMLMGRSAQTHRRHANRMSELISGDGEGGFGHIRDGIELFATSCPLPAFADTWPEGWQLGDAPCGSIYEAGVKKSKLCPAWELCGRVKNQRTLVTADVWLGHILSADTKVPAHTSPERLQYFELIAETFDLTIFDECDETQNVLDNQGALTLTLTGDDDSLHIALQKTIRLVAANQVKVSDGLLRYIIQANEFEHHMLRFLSEIRRLEHHKRTKTDYADQLLTANFLLREALMAAGTYEQFSSRALSGISDFWERAMYHAAFLHKGKPETAWLKAEEYAPDLGISAPDANDQWLRVTAELKRYLALDHAAEAEEVIESVAVDSNRVSFPEACFVPLFVS